MAWLFVKTQTKAPGASLDKARELLWQGKADAAILLLTNCAEEEHAALALAYRSLAHRMKGSVAQALTDAAKARETGPCCLEGRAAQLAAELTNKDIVSAVGTFLTLKEARPHDVEGHFLHLLCFALLADRIGSMKEDAEGLQVDFVHTPAAHAAVCIFDGQALRAFRAFAARRR